MKENMKISCWWRSQLKKTWIPNVIGKKISIGSRVSIEQLKFAETSDVLAIAVWSSGCVAAKWFTSFLTSLFVWYLLPR